MSFIGDFWHWVTEHGGPGAGGWAAYQAAKSSAIALNIAKSQSPLSDETTSRLGWLYPGLDLAHVRIVQGATLPADWFRPSITGMTFGNTIYIESTNAIDNNFDLLRLVMHELVHVRQMAELGEQTFAWRYGEQWVAHGGYDNHPLEVEAKRFVSMHPFDPDFYLKQWPDVAAALGHDFGAAFAHWLGFGIREGRRSAYGFSVRAYKALNTDLSALSNEDAVLHWIRAGRAEGRRAVFGPAQPVSIPAGGHHTLELHAPSKDELGAVFEMDWEVAAHRWANLHGFVGGTLNHEDSGAHLGVICLPPEVADVCAAAKADLDAQWPGHTRAVQANRWAWAHGYAGGIWNHEDDGTHIGILAIKAGTAEIQAPAYAELENSFPGNPEVAASRWATIKGYKTGCLNYEDDGAHKGVICFK